jgi:hypothetical protein
MRSALVGRRPAPAGADRALGDRLAPVVVAHPAPHAGARFATTARAARTKQARPAPTPAILLAGVRAKCCGCTKAFQAFRAGSIPVARFKHGHGEWRSLVAHPAGGRAVAGSNPVSPTRAKAPLCRHFALYLAGNAMRRGPCGVQGSATASLDSALRWCPPILPLASSSAPCSGDRGIERSWQSVWSGTNKTTQIYAHYAPSAHEVRMVNAAFAEDPVSDDATRGSRRGTRRTRAGQRLRPPFTPAATDVARW